MSDLYSELLVKKEPTAKDSIVKYGMIVLTVLAVGAGLFISPILLLVAVALGVASYFVIPRTDLEYEYLFVNGEFDIDMVMSKSNQMNRWHRLSKIQLQAKFFWIDTVSYFCYTLNQNQTNINTREEMQWVLSLVKALHLMTFC